MRTASSVRAKLELNGYVVENARVISEEHTAVTPTSSSISHHLDERLTLRIDPCAEDKDSVG